MRQTIMRQTSGVKLVLFAAANFALVSAAYGRSVSDRATALIDFPYITIDTAQGVDTVVQLTNSSNASPVSVKCFWENANSHCTDTSNVCRASSPCSPGISCVPDWSVTDFTFTLTPGQPIAFLASSGLSHLPCDPNFPQPGCSTSAAGQVPPVPEDPFVGRLQCLTVNGSGAPTEQNVLRGAATLERYQASPGQLDAARYNAIGLAAIPGANNGDDVLVLGGEYEPCPFATSVTHFFENAVEPVTGASRIFTRLIVAPCSHNPLAPTPGHATADYLVFNEFEQRLAVRKTFDGLKFDRLSGIDPVAWDMGLQGTLAGQTRIANIVDNNGIVLIAVEEQEAIADPTRIASAAFNTHTNGDRFAPDVIGVSSSCGNGVVEPGEQCDDGNQAGGDGCDAGCRAEPCYVCSGSPSTCGPPTQCAAPNASSLLIADHASNDAKDKLVWDWNGSLGEGEFDNPVLVTDYTLCVYDSGQLVEHGSIQRDGTCGGKPCWKALGTKGFHYKNAATNADGLAVATLKRTADSVQISLTGKGTTLALPGAVSGTQYFTQSPSVTVALFKSAGGECWQSDFFAAVKNTPTQFKAALP